jgi:acyl carrier protein
MKEIMQELIVILNKVLPAVNTDNATIKSDLRTDLAIDSFSMILLAISIEDHFHIKLEKDFKPKSVEDVCVYIQGKL